MYYANNPINIKEVIKNKLFLLFNEIGKILNSNFLSGLLKIWVINPKSYPKTND